MSTAIDRRQAFGAMAGMSAIVAAGAAPPLHASGESAALFASSFDRWKNPIAAGIRDVDKIEAMLFPLATTSLMIVRRGRVAWTYGDVTQPSYLASARKSIISMLYGRAIARGAVRLDDTIGDLGIDDDGGLLPLERTATVRHILTSTSGIYHPAGSPGGLDSGHQRGSRAPGSTFVYNNWDFNVAGAIYEKCTGKSLFSAFASELAYPLGMQDFDPVKQRMLGYSPQRSRYLAHHFFLSCRDMAKLGQLMLDGGRWKGRELIPAAWVSQSTQLRIEGSRTKPLGGLGYGYLWWLPTEVRKTAEWAGSFAAMGNYGQYLVCLPALDMVVAHRRAVTDEFAIARNLGRTGANPPAADPPMLPIVDQIVSAITG